MELTFALKIAAHIINISTYTINEIVKINDISQLPEVLQNIP